MLKQILSGIAGYIAMFSFIFVSFRVLYIVLGADGAFSRAPKMYRWCGSR